MPDHNTPLATFSGRSITGRELAEIKETVSIFGNLSQKELTQTICEHLDWRTPSGTNKLDACHRMLKSFEQQGVIRLPEKRSRPSRKPVVIAHTPETAPTPQITVSLSKLDTVALCPVEPDPVEQNQAETRHRIRLWNEYMDRYHYLGYKKPFGYTLRYFIKAGKTLLGCLLFSGAARAMTPRDNWIGWTPDQRRQNLHLIINNSRFLIFPWVRVKNLASHVLGQAGRRIREDWQNKWGFAPVLMETFVDPERYKGSAYLAANWKDVGLTSGKGLVRKGKTYETTPKKILVLPLTENFRRPLCTAN